MFGEENCGHKKCSGCAQCLKDETVTEKLQCADLKWCKKAKFGEENCGHKKCSGCAQCLKDETVTEKETPAPTPAPTSAEKEKILQCAKNKYCKKAKFGDKNCKRFKCKDCCKCKDALSLLQMQGCTVI